MSKPIVFNYSDYEKVVEENKKLKAEVANLQIRCRIAESEKPDRDCKSCKHNKPDGCSRWDCEYEPVMSDLIKKSDAIKALYKYSFVSKNVIEREINAIPSEDRPTGWIPVSERLPEDTSKPVLISGNYKGLGVYAVDIARYNGGMWQYDGFTFPDCDILAWMPLPEPYREDGE